MIGDTFHRHLLDDDWFRFGGGYGIDSNYKPFINFIHEDLTADYWEIPLELKKLLDVTKELGDRNACLRIRDAMRIH